VALGLVAVAGVTSPFTTTSGFVAASALGDVGFAAVALAGLSVTAIAVLLSTDGDAFASGTVDFALDFDSMAVLAVDGDSLFVSGRAGVAASDGAPGAGPSVESRLSADGLSLPGFSLVDRSLDDGDLSAAADFPDDVVVEVSDDFVVPADRDGGGGLIQSSTYGTATAPMTPSTITTRTTRNHVAAKIDRGGTSSYNSYSCSAVGSSRSGLTGSSASG
jgi:hypothetical protein